MRRPVALLALLVALVVGSIPPTEAAAVISSDPVIQTAAGGVVDQLAALCSACQGDTVRFCDVVLGETGFWQKQLEVCDSVDRFGTTLVPAGNSVGKSFMAARIALAFLLSHPNSIVFTTSPSQNQLATILWKEIRSAIRKMPFPLGVEPKGTGPIDLKLSSSWYMTGHVTNRIENATGHHAEHLMVLIDEGSGVPEATYEGAWSLNPSRIVVFGNPLHRQGRFYDLCRVAEAEADNPARTSNLIRIPSTSSPDIHLERSPRGMADQGFLTRNRRDYGEDSIWWLSHVLAQFPDQTAESCVPPDWLKLACKTLHIPGGFRRIAIDCAGGNGGDEWILLCRDDNGILDLKWSNDWKADEAARRAFQMASTWGVQGYRVSFDAAGLGWDFASRLAAAGLRDARAYLGGASGGKKFKRLRSACAQELRFRLDPGRQNRTAAGLYVNQTPFSFAPSHPEWHSKLSEVGLFLRFLDGESYELEKGEDIRARLRRSPDTGDAFFQSFAFGTT